MNLYINFRKLVGLLGERSGSIIPISNFNYFFEIKNNGLHVTIRKLNVFCRVSGENPSRTIDLVKLWSEPSEQ